MREPVWPGRRDDELVECRHHEALLNVAFDREPDFRLVCPYEIGRLDADVVAGALCTHPSVRAVDGRTGSAAYDDDHWALFREPLRPPPPGAVFIDFTTRLGSCVPSSGSSSRLSGRAQGR
jgi:hypothetical protein